MGCMPSSVSRPLQAAGPPSSSTPESSRRVWERGRILLNSERDPAGAQGGSQCWQYFEVAYGQFLAAGRIFGGHPPKNESGGREVLGGVRGRSPGGKCQGLAPLLQFSGVFMRKSQYLYSCKYEDLMLLPIQ
jgi:hypothetical protein